MHMGARLLAPVFRFCLKARRPLHFGGQGAPQGKRASQQKKHASKRGHGHQAFCRKVPPSCSFARVGEQIKTHKNGGAKKDSRYE